MVFVFHLFTQPPIFFNAPALQRLAQSEHAGELRALQGRYDEAFETQRRAASAYVAALRDGGAESAKATLRDAAAKTATLRAEAKELVAKALPDAETKDADYVFISFVLDYVPRGLIGLLVAVILCAAMSSTSSELAALGATSTIDLYKRVLGARAPARYDLLVSKVFTVFWGLVAVSFAAFAALLDNLIQAVNIFGSIFYGTVLGLFVVAFFVRRVTATPVLLAALVAQAVVFALFFLSDLGFLWYNVVGCGVVVVLSLALELMGLGDASQHRQRFEAEKNR
jgi:uncharacterized sodium:solute symporter family permease YidK